MIYRMAETTKSSDHLIQLFLLLYIDATPDSNLNHQMNQIYPKYNLIILPN